MSSQKSLRQPGKPKRKWLHLRVEPKLSGLQTARINVDSLPEKHQLAWLCNHFLAAFLALAAAFCLALPFFGFRLWRKACAVPCRLEGQREMGDGTWEVV